MADPAASIFDLDGVPDLPDGWAYEVDIRASRVEPGDRVAVDVRDADGRLLGSAFTYTNLVGRSVAELAAMAYRVALRSSTVAERGEAARPYVGRHEARHV